jgi:hypothetical protein
MKITITKRDPSYSWFDIYVDGEWLMSKEKANVYHVEDYIDFLSNLEGTGKIQFNVFDGETVE